MSSWYMRDNHTFVKIPSDVDEAMAVLRETFDAPCGHHGMLASKDHDRTRLGVVHAAGDWAEFAPRARAWLVMADAPTAADLEYSSWISQISQERFNEKMNALDRTPVALIVETIADDIATAGPIWQAIQRRTDRRYVFS